MKVWRGPSGEVLGRNLRQRRSTAAIFGGFPPANDQAKSRLRQPACASRQARPGGGRLPALMRLLAHAHYFPPTGNLFKWRSTARQCCPGLASRAGLELPVLICLWYASWT